MRLNISQIGVLAHEVQPRNARDPTPMRPRRVQLQRRRELHLFETRLLYLLGGLRKLLQLHPNLHLQIDRHRLSVTNRHQSGSFYNSFGIQLESKYVYRRSRGTSESQADDNGSIAESVMSVKAKRRLEPERIQYFKDEPHCGKLEPHEAECTKCDKVVKLGHAQTYSIRPWDIHRSRCDSNVSCSPSFVPFTPNTSHLPTDILKQ